MQMVIEPQESALEITEENQIEHEDFQTHVS